VIARVGSEPFIHLADRSKRAQGQSAPPLCNGQTGLTVSGPIRGSSGRSRTDPVVLWDVEVSLFHGSGSEWLLSGPRCFGDPSIVILPSGLGQHG
jgi:hypothetical protein